MSAPRFDLPMAPAGCALDASGLVAQRARYRRLGAAAATAPLRDLELLVSFDATVDLDLLHETIAIERQCCSFFTLEYDTAARRLSISADRADRLDSLRALLSAIR